MTANVLEATMTPAELSQCESVIARGIKTFVEVGNALMEIRDRRGYRFEFKTFEEYCQARWNLSQSRVYQMIDAAKVHANLESSTIVELPATESQTRPLAALEPDQQIEAWRRAVETAPNGRITAAHVEQVAQSIRATRPENIHVSDDSYEWYTPAEIIEAARAVMGGIDLDPASSADANKIVRARKFYTKDDDGLERAWGGRVWMNPPYNMPLVEQFTAKASELYQSGQIGAAVVLVNNATDAAWFHALLSQYPVCFTRGRVKYWGPHASQARQGQAIFYLGTNDSAFASEFGKIGAVLRAL